MTSMHLISPTFMVRREKRHDAVVSAETVEGYPSRSLVIVVADDQGSEPTGRSCTVPPQRKRPVGPDTGQKLTGELPS